MSENGKIKVYKNKARAEEEKYTPYIPQWQKLGLEPEEVKHSQQNIVAPMAVPAPQDIRGARPAIRQPYAEAVDSPIGRGRGLLPNVGNNIEQTWSSIDGELDDMSDVDLNHPLIDNNEFVTEEAMDFQQSTQVLPTASDAMSAINDLESDFYLLFLKNKPLCSGDLPYIEEQISNLIFGESEFDQGQSVSIDDLIVIKKIKLKVGVFLA